MSPRSRDAVADFYSGNQERIDPGLRYFGWQVAYLVFGRSERWWSRNRHRLLREGFPRPISNTFNAPWFGADLLAWMGREKTEAAENTPHSIVDITARLRERAAKVAAG